MKVVIVGAGSVGRSISQELISSDHEVTLVDRAPAKIKVAMVPDADWVLGDACSPDVLEELGARECDALVAMTGDDKVNLVVSLIAKTMFGVPKVIARANHTANEWMYNETWGVDVLASTPRALTSLVEEAVSVGQAVQLLAMDQTSCSVFTVEVPEDSVLISTPASAVQWPSPLIVSAVVRKGTPKSLVDCGPLQAGDELIVVTGRGQSDALGRLESMVTEAMP